MITTSFISRFYHKTLLNLQFFASFIKRIFKRFFLSFKNALSWVTTNCLFHRPLLFIPLLFIGFIGVLSAIGALIHLYSWNKKRINTRNALKEKEKVQISEKNSQEKKEDLSENNKSNVAEGIQKEFIIKENSSLEKLPIEQKIEGAPIKEDKETGTKKKKSGTEIFAPNQKSSQQEEFIKKKLELKKDSALKTETPLKKNPLIQNDEFQKPNKKSSTPSSSAIPLSKDRIKKTLNTEEELNSEEEFSEASIEDSKDLERLHIGNSKFLKNYSSVEVQAGAINESSQKKK